jgi:hypothetical protein
VSGVVDSPVDVRTVQPHALAGTMILWLTWSASEQRACHGCPLAEAEGVQPGGPARCRQP